MSHGAPLPGSDIIAWLNLWMPRITRPLKHAGNHRYAWAFQRSLQKDLERNTIAYPKRTL